MNPVTGSPDDGELAVRAQRGELAAFEELVRRHEAMAVRIAAVVCGSSNAEDAAQEAFVRAYRSLHRFDPERPFRPWLARIVANVAKNQARSADRHRRLVLDAPRPGPAPDLAGDAAIAADRRSALAAALDRLPEGDRLVLALRWFEDMSEREMAGTLGVRPGTVKSRLSRAMQHLRSELSETELAHG
jgi:RNA polymerase sigma-70 factor (ECF subfamily)